MSKFRKKPVVIEAKQWFNHGDHSMVEPYDPEKAGAYIKGPGPHGWVKTLEGGHIVSPGDWIIKGVKGEFYPCKPDIFAATYDAEPVQSSTGLPPHQQRVLDEKQDLDLRIARLDEFMRRNPTFPTLDAAERDRLEIQLDLMRDLSGILGERIAAF